jgi:phosphatidylserine/phosphatidylglycerophosphate/cardiolipin synthase-like enzyme
MCDQQQLKRIEELCSAKHSVSSIYADESEKSPGDIANSLYKSHLLTASTRGPKRVLTKITKHELDFARRCGRFEETEPSDLFLSAYYSSLLCLEGDSMTNCCSPPLCGTTGIVPMAVIGSIHDQLRHVSNLIARAEHEVLLATNFWKASKSSTYISDALRELSARSQRRGVIVVVRIMYDRGAAAQIFNNHQDVGPQGWTNVNVGLPNPEDIPGIELKVVNFHRPPLGTFHAKFMVVDRRIATVQSNNVQDNDNMEMTTHLEGPIVDSLWDTFIVSWHNSLVTPLPTRQSEAGNSALPITMDTTFANVRLDEAGHIENQSMTTSTDLAEHIAGDPQYDSSLGEEMMRMQATLRGKNGTSPAEAVARHLSSTTNSNFLSGLQPDVQVGFLPFVAVHQPKLVPMAMVSRKPYANLNNESVHVPQNEAFLALVEHAKHSIFIQTPNLNAKDLLPALAAALERGVEVTYYVCLGYNDAGEMLPGQGGTNEQAAGKLFDSLASDEAKSRLGIFFYVAADQIEPRHNSFKQRSCHIKLLIADGQVAIQGSGNQDTQTWYHSQEVNVMIDSAEVCKVWRAGIERNQNTAKYGRVARDGFWYDQNGEIPPGTTRPGGGISGVIHGALGMLRKAQGK